MADGGTPVVRADKDDAAAVTSKETWLCAHCCEAKTCHFALSLLLLLLLLSLFLLLPLL